VRWRAPLFDAYRTLQRPAVATATGEAAMARPTQCRAGSRRRPRPGRRRGKALQRGEELDHEAASTVAGHPRRCAGRPKPVNWVSGATGVRSACTFTCAVVRSCYTTRTVDRCRTRQHSRGGTRNSMEVQAMLARAARWCEVEVVPGRFLADGAPGAGGLRANGARDVSRSGLSALCSAFAPGESGTCVCDG
jgi:hypothetical protein